MRLEETRMRFLTSMPRLTPGGVNGMTGQRPRGPARLSRARALAAAMTGALLLLAYTERVFLARIVVEVVLRVARIAG
jgi:hypothetical protein